MPKVTFISHDGTPHTVDAASGASCMQAALDNGVPGIDADCGGQCSCATCHVIVDPAWSARVGPPGVAENGMLGLTPERTDTSRLSCQVVLDDALDGLVLHLPEFQM
ncbi:MAG: 2Fe-2S iron-sulfur cluster-binding protein [Gammaproteobacteria bacterium]